MEVGKGQMWRRGGKNEVGWSELRMTSGVSQFIPAAPSTSPLRSDAVAVPTTGIIFSFDLLCGFWVDLLCGFWVLCSFFFFFFFFFFFCWV